MNIAGNPHSLTLRKVYKQVLPLLTSIIATTGMKGGNFDLFLRPDLCTLQTPINPE